MYSLNSLSVNELNEPALLLATLLLVLLLVVAQMRPAVSKFPVMVAIDGSGPVDGTVVVPIVIGGGRHSATKDATEFEDDITSPLVRDI